MSDVKRYAEPGFIWQCQACGKTSETDAYGIEGNHSRGWDESCALNCVQIPAALSGATPADGECQACDGKGCRHCDPEYDPTPWCSGCGARRRSDCHCGPIADNE